MRVLLCKIQCPSFLCFCKPSPHIYTASGSLKLEENTPPQVSTTTVVVDDNDDDDDDHYVDAHAAECVDHATEDKEEACAVEEKQEKEEQGEILKSSLKKAALDSPREKQKKKKVQWVDLMGKELAEIREFESSKEDDIRYDGDQSCVCVIL
ncbi:hypothetical protein Rs2_46054 [Raphanus sativus]|uniref:Uncharacterized protein LOC108837491 n=1 Tax=Raphanus sativus TaxID=3726 RepID=A0A6J0M154_RAPSA|nr:uncharacterized protein LOC108837491 [Raphanus sativus]XP_056852816.1 uncharacterized protein LOC108837491 [Raphanus sativus]KAJ4872289.1 hypothetical protein Rs2_46054 [Raphanus sativus]